MMDMNDLARQLEQSGKADKLKALADSKDGRRLSAMVDAQAAEAAVKSGDAEAMRRILGGLLATEEGRRMAEALRETLS